MARTEVPSDPKYDRHFTAIGRVADMWAQLEFHIDTAIWEFAEVQQMLGACITSQLIGINNRIRALSSLVQARNGSAKSVKAVRKFGANLSILQQKRHRTVHDPRHVNRATGELTRLEITADHNLVFEFKPEDIQKLEETRDEIAAKVREFKKIHAAISAELDALPDKDQPILRRIVPVKKDGSTPATEP